MKIDFERLNYSNFSELERFSATKSSLEAQELLVNRLSKRFGIQIQDWSEYLNIEIEEIHEAVKYNPYVKEHTAAHILLVYDIFKRGEDVFGSSMIFQKWIVNEHANFKNRKPKDLLSNPIGIILLMKELNRLSRNRSSIRF